MVKIPLMVAKPVLKKVIKAVDKSRKEIRKFRKNREKESSPSTTALNRAQERLEKLRDVKNVTLEALKNKMPKKGLKLIENTFKDAARKRATIRNIMADPKKYNVLSELRNGLISKDKLPKLVSKKSLDFLMENIEFLKKYNVIEELNYNGETYIVLKTNLQITTAFPEWMRKLLPKESEPIVANKYTPELRDNNIAEKK